MRQTALLAILILSASVARAQERTDVVMSVDGVNRQFIVVQPSAPAPIGGYPLVFMFHGSGGDGEQYYNVSGWKEKGEEEGFVTVFPSSLDYCVIEDGMQRRVTKWNNGDLRTYACPGQELKDDVAFVRAMLDSIAGRLPIDRSRIFASGFSNGGVFSSKLAIDMSDVFAAAHASAGALDELDSAGVVRNVPYVLTVGDHDDRLLEKSEFDVIPFNDTALGFIRPRLERHLAILGLTQEYATTETELALLFSFTTPEADAPPAELRFILLKGLYHQYPNGENYPLSAPDLMWEFFSARPLVSLVVDPVEGRPAITVVPNPATAQLRIVGVESSRVVLRSSLGATVAELPVGSDGRVALPALPRGLYLMEIVTEEGRIVRRVIVGE